jgi:hypothetical protein
MKRNVNKAVRTVTKNYEQNLLKKVKTDPKLLLI